MEAQLAGLWYPDEASAPEWRQSADEQEAINRIDRILARIFGAGADARLIQQLRPLLLDALIAGAESAAAGLGLDVTISLASPIAEQYLAQRIPDLVGINAFTARRVRNLIVEEIRKGSPLGVQVKRLRTQFNVWRRGRRVPGTQKFTLSRARTIARTETGIAWGTGQHAQNVDAGVLAEIWITSRDLRVRDSHITLEGDCALIDETFDNGLLHPLDPSGPPGEVINCRCTAAPAPRGCEEPRLATYDDRTRYWRQSIAEQRPHELALARAMRAIWTEQERAIIAAMRKAA